MTRIFQDQIQIHPSPRTSRPVSKNASISARKRLNPGHKYSYNFEAKISFQQAWYAWNRTEIYSRKRISKKCSSKSRLERDLSDKVHAPNTTFGNRTELIMDMRVAKPDCLTFSDKTLPYKLNVPRVNGTNSTSLLANDTQRAQRHKG